MTQAVYIRTSAFSEIEETAHFRVILQQSLVASQRCVTTCVEKHFQRFRRSSLRLSSLPLTLSGDLSFPHSQLLIDYQHQLTFLHHPCLDGA